jgi:MFS family permease
VMVLLSIFVVRETSAHAALESKAHFEATPDLTAREVFVRTTVRDRNLSSITQAGFVNNLNDGMAWGLLPLFYASAGLAINRIGILAALYPAVWGLAQLFTGAWSDQIGRRKLIVGGMAVQAGGIGLIAASHSFDAFACGAVLLGLGTAMVYPTLLAGIGDVAHPRWRASAVGVYRLWRDLGYAAGAVVAGVTADAFGLRAALWLVAGITFMSGIVAWLRMSETMPRRATQSQDRRKRIE